MKIDKKVIISLVAIIFAVLAFVYVKNNFSFGFAPLFCFLIAFLILPVFLKDRVTTIIKDSQTQKSKNIYVKNRNGEIKINAANSTLCALAIFVFGLLTLYSLGNYFNPPKEVYSNYQHHALKIEGVKVGSLPFQLAGANDHSFFDSPDINGQIEIVDYDSLFVRLKLKGVTNPVYLKSNTNDHKNLNETLLAFDKGDVVELISTEKDDDGNHLSCKFVLNEGQRSDLLRTVDTTSCVFMDNDNPEALSSFSRYIKSGYPLSGMAADFPTKMDLTGIKIVRDTINLDVKRRDINEVYSDRNFLMEIAPNARIHSVIVNGGEPYVVENQKDVVDYIEVPVKRSVYIGLGNHSLNSFRFEVERMGDDYVLFVKYALPQYQYLTANEGSKSTALMVTTSIIDDETPEDGDSGLIDQLTDNVLLYDLFHSYTNTFNINPFFVSYTAGPTTEKMSFTVSSGDSGVVKHDIPTEQAFPSIKSRNGTEWVVKVENFKDSTPFGATKIAWIMVIIILLSTFSMINSSHSGDEVKRKSGASLYTSLEYAFHLVIIAFLAVRFFMLWRTTVFPPISSVSLYEFEHFRESRWIVFPLLLVGGFYVSINLLKWALYYRRNHLRRSNRISKEKLLSRIFGKPLAAMIIIPIVEIGFGALGKFSGSPVLSVFVPIAIYLFFDFCIYKRYATSYIEDIANSKRKSSGKPQNRTYALLMSIYNMMITSGVTLFVDGGFGVMFTMFMIFSFIFKVIDLIQFENKRSKKSIAAYWVLFITLLIIILSYKDIFILLFHCIQNGSKIWLFFAVAWLVVVFITLCVILVLNIEFKKSQISLPIIYTVICVIGSLLAPQISGSHMEFRTRVHMESAGDILKSVDSPEAQNKFLQASLNDWILYEYQEIGKEVKSFGEDGYGYFKIQPQSKLGAMWFAQTTDICLSRYIIAEHGTFLAILFIIAFATVLFLALRSTSCIRWTRVITVQITLLIAVQALMILLANTRAFIFFGQDFPILSLTSRLSSIYFFCLATLAVGAALISRYCYDEEVKKEEDEEILTNNSKASCRSMMLFFLLAAAVLYLSNENLNVSENKEKSKSEKQNSPKRKEGVPQGAYDGDRTYDIDVVLTQMNGEIDTYINQAFAKYQKDSLERIPALKKNMTPVVEDFFKKFDPDSLLADCSDHTRHIFNQFRSTWVKSNSKNNIIYLRYRRSYDSKMRTLDTLEFAVRNEYYRYELPGKSKVQWQGSILGESSRALADAPYIKPLTGHSYAYIPAKYSADGAPVQLLKISGNKALRVISSEAIMSMGKSLDVIEVDPMDYIMHRGNTLKDSPLANQDYIAKRILLNGNRKFIYPHGQKLFWARSESANVQGEKRKEKDYSDTDVQFTTDVNLCSNIYDVIENVDRGKTLRYGGDDRTVVVADGDGNIRALVDHRLERKYRINPNNYKAIAAVSDSLDMYGERGRAAESRYFGDFNRDFLRLGPGSSQKPILWSAVTSMYNTGWWDDLKMASIKHEEYSYMKHISRSYAKDIADGGRYYFRKFAGKPIESKFRSLKGDEGSDRNFVDLKYYMYKSSNFYNAIVAYIGSFPHDYFESDDFLDISDERDGETLFRKKEKLTLPQARKDEKEQIKEYRRYANDYQSTFPIVYLDNKRPLQFNKFLDYDFALDENTLASKGLNDNFSLGSKRQSAYNPSRFNVGIRKDRKSARELNEYMVRSVAIGTNTLWQVSPRKMAEMFGKLISMNKAYELHLEHTNPTYEFFELDDSWGHGERNQYKDYMKARKELLLGMSQVFSIGTAKGLGLNGKKLDSGYVLTVDDGKEETADDTKRLYIYGKTGTINGKWGGSDDKEDHLLATVITDKKVSVCSPDDLKSMKFYVIYQADFNYTSWTSVDANVILEVLKSDTFNKYMNIK